jgi:Lipocalin-like domain
MFNSIFVKHTAEMPDLSNLKTYTMKKGKILALALLAISFGACSDDDASNNDSGSIEGVYDLTEFNTSVATDFNEDGTESTNQMDETNCYDTRKIDFNSDNTFTYDLDYILINTATGEAVCTTSDVSGTWTASNNTITAVYEEEDGTEVTLTFTRSEDSDTLTQNTVLTTFPDRDAEGVAFNRVGSVELVFTK